MPKRAIQLESDWQLNCAAAMCRLSTRINKLASIPANHIIKLDILNEYHQMRDALDLICKLAKTNMDIN